jgi:two-component system sensor histidine kinase KdpD
MPDHRPNPDALLLRVQAAESQQRRGRLKVFFGAAAGVGKTYAMLEAAQQRRSEGIDVVAGYIQTHGRAETDALLEGLEQLPVLVIDYRGATLREFDLDAALQRKPALILVDELAHTNAPGLRHAKRWQDIQELIQAGINVYTTVNVQHLESLNDVVAQITAVQVRETVPDAVLEGADEVELIDLPPDDLLDRLRDGKIYLPQQAERAAQHFFRKGNLMALRELALRHTADRVDEQMQRYMQDHAIPTTWPATERLLVCVGPSPLSARLVRAGKRMATRLRAEWLVVYVETPAHIRLSQAARDQVASTLRQAEKLGAQTSALSGPRVSEEVLRYARQRNVTQIVVGKPARPRWRERLFGSVVDDLVRESGAIDVYVISGDSDAAPSAPARFQPTSTGASYGKAVALVAFCTLVADLMHPALELSNLVMVYLLGVTGAAFRYGRGPSILASVLSVAAFDFFFVQPYLTFAVSDVQYILTFLVMLVVALTISTLTVQVRAQADLARQRERRTAALYAMTRELASTRGLENLLRAAADHISAVFESQTMILLPDSAGTLQPHLGTELPLAHDQRERGTAQWVYDHGQMAGMHTETLPSAAAIYLPLVATRGSVGVLGVQPADERRLLDPEQVHLLETFANQTAVAIERAHLAEEAQAATVQVETERLRNALLSSVSHDLRTPLASISGAASTLVDTGDQLDVAIRRELAQTIADEGERLNRLLTNLLEMTRLEAGAVQVRKEWQPLEEVVGSALARLDRALDARQVSVAMPADLALVPLDSVLIEQVLVNLLDNALKYTPPGGPLAIAAAQEDAAVVVRVADRGPGLPEQALTSVFDKFYRIRAASDPAGPVSAGSVGLGLAICRGIVEAHGGRIWAENRPGGGAVFAFTLPLDGEPPALDTALLD